MHHYSEFLKYIYSLGSSLIKEYKILKKTINIHMGVSPYYRGADCNFE